MDVHTGVYGMNHTSELVGFGEFVCRDVNSGWVYFTHSLFIPCDSKRREEDIYLPKRGWSR